jgi:ribosomal protein L24E
MRSQDFSLQDLYAALDAQRQARGLSWTQVAKEINGPPEQVRGHALSASTITGTRIRSVAEADGILQMLRWLQRSPESFLPHHQVSNGSAEKLPAVSAHQVLRFNTKKIYAALDAQRSERKMTWVQIGKELGLSGSSLRHLEKGGRTSFPSVMRILGWLGRPASEFTHGVGGAP